MWFKNLIIYRWNCGLFVEELEEQLERGRFSPCPQSEPASRGWVPPRGDAEGPLVYSQGKQHLLTLRIDQRLLPADVVAAEVATRATALTESQGYAPGRRQLREMKERVVEELMPRSFIRTRYTNVWIDTANGILGVEASTQAKAEEVIYHLLYSLDDFPLEPFFTQLSPVSAMSDWLAGGEAPSGFTIDRDCELKAKGEEKSAVKFTRHPLNDEVHAEIKAHLAAGKLPTKLALTWDDRLSFVLTEKLEVKRLSFLDLVKEQAEQAADDAYEQFEADFALMTGELRRFIPCLADALGGLVQED